MSNNEHIEKATMKRWKKLFLWTFGTILLIVLALFIVIFQSMRPTKGARIRTYETPHMAMLIIDIQEDYTGPQAKKKFRHGDRIVSVSNALLAQAQAKGVAVVYIENVISNPIISILTGGINSPGSPGTEMDRRLLKIPTARTFTKSRSDAFSNPELDAYLQENRIDQLQITGLDAAYCVNATTQGALNRGYKITIFSEAIATESSKSVETLAQGWRKAGAQVKAGSTF